MTIYPIMLQIENKHCVVVGGGKIATRKIAALLQAKAKVTVVSPNSSTEIIEWSKENVVVVKEKQFEKDDVKDAFLVIAATNSSEINLQVYEAANKNQLINIVDRPELGNFIVPTVLNRGKLAIAISTSGSSPSLAQKMKSELAEIYDDSYELYLEFLDETRKELKVQIKDTNIRNKLLKHLLDPLYLHLTREGKCSERNKHFQKYLLETIQSLKEE